MKVASALKGVNIFVAVRKDLTILLISDKNIFGKYLKKFSSKDNNRFSFRFIFSYASLQKIFFRRS